jgi:transglutaminase-like putative cysteine protease
VPLREWEKVQKVLRRHQKRLIPLAIIAFWLIMMGLLFHRELGTRFWANAPANHFSPVPTESWMGLSLPSGDRVGFMNVNTWPQSRDGEQGTSFSAHAKVRMSLLGRQVGLTIAGSAWTAREGNLAEFDFTVRSEGHDVRVTAEIAEGRLAGEMHTAGDVRSFTLPIQEGLLFSGAMGASGPNLGTLEPGAKIEIDAFDPMSLSVAKAQVECLGEETLLIGGESFDTKIVLVSIKGLVTKTWVADDGETIRAETPFGFTMEKIAPEDAVLGRNGSADAEDLYSVAAVRPRGKRPFRGAKRMILRLGALDADTPIPKDSCQKQNGAGHWVLTRPSLPLDSPQGDEDEASLAPYLEPHPFVQSDNVRIQEAAQSIVGEAETPWDRALAIHNWMYEHIEKKVILSVPSALDVLDSKEGDCNEHTVLFTALARAQGIPARIALGIVWSDEFKAFYYHAWPEVYAGQWMRLDPTLGQPLADATHIKLLTGTIEQWPRLLPFIGRLEVEVLEVE